MMTMYIKFEAGLPKPGTYVLVPEADVAAKDAEIDRLQAKLEKAEERTMLAAAQKYCSICGNILKGE